jgi:excisionase family DNA binding protein
MANTGLGLGGEGVDVDQDDSPVRGKTIYELDELLTIEDVAALLRVSKSWIYDHTRKRGTPRSGQLPFIKIGKYVRFEPRAIREFLARRTRM